MFGHVIHFNFDGTGNEHKTIVGGILSLFIKLFISVYVVYNVDVMIFKKDNTYNTLLEVHNLNIEGEVLFNETRITVFHQLSKQNSGPVMLNQTDLGRYITIGYSENEIDFQNNTSTSKPFPARSCTRADFGDGEQGD